MQTYSNSLSRKQLKHCNSVSGLVLAEQKVILGTTRKESLNEKKMIGESFQEVTSQLFKVTSENDRNSWNSNMPRNHYTRTN